MSNKLLFICSCGASYPNLAGLVKHYGSIHRRTAPATRLRQPAQAIADGLELVADGATVADAADAVGLPTSTLQWHVWKRGGVKAVRDEVPA